MALAALEVAEPELREALPAVEEAEEAAEAVETRSVWVSRRMNRQVRYLPDMARLEEPPATAAEVAMLEEDMLAGIMLEEALEEDVMEEALEDDIIADAWEDETEDELAPLVI